MIVLTGAAGFIGSCMLRKLNDEGFQDIVLVDDFSSEGKRPNYEGKTYTRCVPRHEFAAWVSGKEALIQFVIHLGARTDTTEMDVGIFNQLNLAYSKMVWQLCAQHQIPLIYASSAATYGGGEWGYEDAHELVPRLRPLNPYGQSKNDFDAWALAQESAPFFWAGLKFFNVYGPNEYHKGRMASVVYHTFHQIQRTGRMRLFRSHHPDFNDGEQQRDFIYVKDVVEVIQFLMEERPRSGLYNLGTGTARTFQDLATQVFLSLDRDVLIEYIDTPKDIRANYQYFTQAAMYKLRENGYQRSFYSLEAGIDDYVRTYLLEGKWY